MLNKVILMGRLCADPDFRQTPSGVAVCRIRLAIDRRFTNKQTGEREADFINVSCWRQQAEFVSRYFHKGSMIIVEGSLRNNDYTDQNGVKHYSMEVLADNVTFGESKRSAQENGGGCLSATGVCTAGSCTVRTGISAAGSTACTAGSGSEQRTGCDAAGRSG